MAKVYEKINFNDVIVEETKDIHDEDTSVEIETTKKEFSLEEKNKLKETIKAMSDDEQLIGLKVISSDKLWSELRRRNVAMQSKIDNFNNILGVSVSTINPIPESSWDGMTDRYADIERRFNEIAKLMGV